MAIAIGLALLYLVLLDLRLLPAEENQHNPKRAKRLLRIDSHPERTLLPPMQSLSEWILIVLLAISSPTKRAIQQQSPWYQASALRESPESLESAKDGEARYAEIARDLAEVVEAEKPLFQGPLGRQKTAALMLSIQYFESGFRRDVDLGLGKFGRGDFGRSWCLNQIQTGKMPGTVPIDHPEMSKWTGEDLVKDRKKCFRAGLEILRRSMAMCTSATVKKGEYYTVVVDKKPIRKKAEEDTVVPLTGGHRLSGYTSGKCQYGESKAVARWDFAWHNITWRFPFKPIKKDADPSAAAPKSSEKLLHTRRAPVLPGPVSLF